MADDPPTKRDTLDDASIAGAPSAGSAAGPVSDMSSEHPTMVDSRPAVDRMTLDDATVNEPVETRRDRTTLDDIQPAPVVRTTDPDGVALPDALPGAAAVVETPAMPEAVDDVATDEAAAGEAAPPAAAPVAPAKKKRTWLFAILGVVLVVALTGPVLFYFFVFRYQPTAVKHIPAGTHIAVRLDAKELYLFKPFRDHIISAIDAPGAAKERGDRLKKLTGIDLRSDLREIVLASSDGQHWLLLLGGYFNQARFNRADVVKGLRTFFEEQGATGFTDKDGVLYGPDGLELTQADDSTIIIANDEGLVKAALQTSDEWMSLGIAGSGAMSFVVDKTALDHMKASLQGFDDAAFLGHAQQISGSLTLGASPTLSVELVPRNVDVETLSKETTAAIADVQLVTVFFSDNMGEKDALKSAQVKPRADTVMLTANWPYDGLDKGLATLGDAIAALPKGAPATSSSAK